MLLQISLACSSNHLQFFSEMRYFLERLISRGDYESAAILAKNNALWVPTEFLLQDEMSAQNLFLYRLMRVKKVMTVIFYFIT